MYPGTIIATERSSKISISHSICVLRLLLEIASAVAYKLAEIVETLVIHAAVVLGKDAESNDQEEDDNDENAK